MSQYDDENNNDSDLVKDLRKQLADKDKTIKELAEKFDGVSKRDRERTLNDVFKEKGVPAKAAKFFPADAEVTEESVDAWLSEYADVFGLQKVETNESQEPAPQVPDAYARLQAIQSPSVSTGAAADLLHQVTNATEADLLAMILAAGGGAAS